MRVFVPNNYRNSFKKNKQQSATETLVTEAQSNSNSGNKNPLISIQDSDNQKSECETSKPKASSTDTAKAETETGTSIAEPPSAATTTDTDTDTDIAGPPSSTELSSLPTQHITSNDNQQSQPQSETHPFQSAATGAISNFSSLFDHCSQKHKEPTQDIYKEQKSVTAKGTVTAQGTAQGTAQVSVDSQSHSKQKRRPFPVEQSCSNLDSKISAASSSKRQRSNSSPPLPSILSLSSSLVQPALTNGPVLTTNTNTNSQSFRTGHLTNMGLPPTLQQNANANAHKSSNRTSSSSFSISTTGNDNDHNHDNSNATSLHSRGRNNTRNGYTHGQGQDASIGLACSESRSHSQTQSQTQTQTHSEDNAPVPTEFQKALKRRGLEEVEQEGDGNCLFRAVSLQIYGDSDCHEDVRRRCIDFMENEQEHFAQFVTDEPFHSYIFRKRQGGVHANNPEIQAISELYNRPVEVFIPSNGASPINIFQSEYKTGDTPLRVSYHDGNHYNAVIDPLLPTAGLGLGLPGLEPGLADKLQMEEAVRESHDVFVKKIAKETHDLELKRAMEESKKSMTKRDCDYMLQKKKLSISGGIGWNYYDDLKETDLELERALFNSLETFQRSEGSQKMPSAVGRGGGRGPGRGRFGTAVGATAVNEDSHSQHPQHLHSASNINMHVNGNIMDGADVNMNGTSTGARSSTGRHHSNSSRSHSSSSSSPAVASLAVAASSSSAASSDRREEVIPPHDALRQDSSSCVHDRDRDHGEERDEYPEIVQELVMNGFELSKVLKAYDLIGDDFDSLLAFLVSSTAYT